ncbi:MAG TPA: helicase C-terminal domain-containing protein [Candidatus Dormibacteraeota bacterium]|nr:helicase C-terminal domain-containing protein [Candidatus Dormibacteraeota bacterium]
MPEYAAIDLETTGLDPARDRVIEVGAVAFTPDRITSTLERLVDPGRSVPDTVLRLTGIKQEELRGAASPESALGELAEFIRGRQPVGHGARLDVDFLTSAGLWDPAQEILDTLDVSRILLPAAASHSLPLLAVEMGFSQPRPHRALDDADATRQLLLRLREEAAAFDEGLKESMLALVAPYEWPIARFFAEAFTAPNPDPMPVSARRTHSLRVGKSTGVPPDDPDVVAALLRPEGPLAGVLPDYEHREPQLQMLLAVAQIQARGGTLVVEAGTGTGKSLAYLVPSIARAVRFGERVVVSTNTHTLQEQLMSKDLPGLREWLPWDFKSCLLKGRSNYVSLRRWRRYLAELCHDADELRFKLKVLVWLHSTESGDRSELRLHGREEVFWARIASDPLDCIGIHCTGEDCYVHRARAEAEAADLVVVNHSLLLADAEVGGGLLPPFEHLVIDEAHHLEEAATRGLRQEIDGPGLLALLERLASFSSPPSGEVPSGSRSEPHGEGDLHYGSVEERGGDNRRSRDMHSGLLEQLRRQPHLGESTEALAQAVPLTLVAVQRVSELFESAVTWVGARLNEGERRDDSLRLTSLLREDAGWLPVRLAGENAVTALAALDRTLRRAVGGVRDWLGGAEPDQGVRELELIRGRLHVAAALVDEALQKPDANRVYWFTLISRSENLVLRAAPINVGSLLREHVYAERRSTVFTSATLAVGGSFDYFRSRVGLGPEVEELILPSPFDFLHQALVCLPTDFTGPEHEDFDRQVEEVIAAVARRVGGRTLVLFTSHRQLRDLHTALKHRVDLDEVLILGQGIDGQRRQLLKTFEEADRPLLLGTASFWEGIDVPGERLSCVIMVRLPFPVPTEPVYAARAEQVRDAFIQLALPQAALRLKQGFGRLIRRSTDRGAVVILDNRILGRDYGKAFLDVLPPASRFVGPAGEIADQVGQWLGGKTPSPPEQGGVPGAGFARPGPMRGDVPPHGEGWGGDVERGASDL